MVAGLDDNQDNFHRYFYKVSFLSITLAPTTTLDTPQVHPTSEMNNDTTA
jgi:hypothetical protein